MKKDDVNVTVNGIKVSDIAKVEYSIIVGGFVLYHKSGAITVVPLKK